MSTHLEGVLIINPNTGELAHRTGATADTVILGAQIHYPKLPLEYASLFGDVTILPDEMAYLLGGCSMPAGFISEVVTAV